MAQTARELKRDQLPERTEDGFTRGTEQQLPVNEPDLATHPYTTCTGCGRVVKVVTRQLKRKGRKGVKGSAAYRPKLLYIVAWHKHPDSGLTCEGFNERPVDRLQEPPEQTFSRGTQETATAVGKCSKCHRILSVIEEPRGQVLVWHKGSNHYNTCKGAGEPPKPGTVTEL